MKHLKKYEGFFNFFSKSEDDKIALEFIKRLKKVDGVSPYDMKIKFGDDPNFELCILDINFDDTPIKLISVVKSNSIKFSENSQILLAQKEYSMYSEYKFYKLVVICEGKEENCLANVKILKRLAELARSVYDKDRNIKRLENIKSNMNSAADIIDN